MSDNDPPALVRQKFAQRLKDEIAKRGWRQSDLAKEASKHLPDGQELSRDNVSNYFRQKVLPGPPFLEAIAKAFGTTSKDLLPERAIVSVRENSLRPAFSVQDVGDGEAWVQINQRLPWPVALEIMAAVNRPDGEKT